MTLPAAASLLFVVLPWREAVALLGGIGVLAAIAIFLRDAALPRRKPPRRARREDGDAPAARLRAYGFPLLLSVGVIDSATRMAFLTFLPFVLTAKGASLPTDRPGADAGVRRRRGRQAGLRLHRRAHRRGGDGLADRGGDRARHRRAAAAAARSGARAVAGGRHRAQRHLVGALWLGAGSGGAGAAPARLRHLLYRHDRRRRGVAGDLRPARRRGRRAVGAGGGGRRRADHAADHAGPATGAR